MTSATGQNLPRLQLILLSSGYLVMGMTLLVVVGLAPLMEQGLALEPRQTSILLSVFALVYALCAPLIQIWFAWIPVRLLVSAGLILAASGIAMMANAESFTVLLTGRVIAAVGCSITGPSVATFATAIAPPGKRAAALGIVFMGMTLANVVAVPLFAALGIVLGWRSALAIMAAISALFCLVPLTMQDPKQPFVPTRLRDLLEVLGRYRSLLALLVTSLQMGAQFVVYSVMSVFIFARYDGDITLLPLALLVFGAGGLLGNLLSTVASYYVSVERLITLSLVALATTLSLLMIKDMGTPLFLGLVGLWSASGMMMMAPQQARLTTLTDGSPAPLLAMNLSMVYLGIALGGWAGGTVVATSGVEGLLPVAVVIVLLALGCHLATLIPAGQKQFWRRNA